MVFGVGRSLNACQDAPHKWHVRGAQLRLFDDSGMPQKLCNVICEGDALCEDESSIMINSIEREQRWCFGGSYINELSFFLANMESYSPPNFAIQDPVLQMPPNAKRKES